MSQGSDFKRVLSIQSTVVSGYVGGKSATFPLQLLGFDVCNINSVQFSNHTGYKVFKGQVLDDVELLKLYDGLKANDIHRFSHLLTGFAYTKSFLETIVHIVKELRDKNPDLTFLCDPVMGDHGKLYVPEELVDVYRDQIVPLADIVTPNQFEAELLTGTQINDEASALRAMKIIHDKGVRIVVLSSSTLAGTGNLLGIATTLKDGVLVGYKVQIPLIPVIFTGTGDLFAALMMAWLHTDKDLKTAFDKTMSTLQLVIKRTYEKARMEAGPGVELTPHQMELALVQSKSDIENPEILYKSEPI